MMSSGRYHWPLAHRQDKQSAPSKINMPSWEAPVIWGLREGTPQQKCLENRYGKEDYLWRGTNSVMV